MQLISAALLLFHTSICSGQINIVNQSLTDSSVNVLYIGVDNKIKLIGMNKKETALSRTIVSGSGNTISKTGPYQCIVRVSSVGKCKIVYSESGRKVFEKEFRTETLEDFVATVGGLKDTVVSKGRLLANSFLKVIIPNCYFRHDRIVRSFQATFIQYSDSTFTTSTDYQFSNEQIKLVKSLNSNDKIYFDNIKSLGADCRLESPLTPFWIRIE